MVLEDVVEYTCAGMFQNSRSPQCSRESTDRTTDGLSPPSATSALGGESFLITRVCNLPFDYYLSLCLYIHSYVFNISVYYSIYRRMLGSVPRLMLIDEEYSILINIVGSKVQSYIFRYEC